MHSVEGCIAVQGQPVTPSQVTGAGHSPEGWAGGVDRAGKPAIPTVMNQHGLWGCHLFPQGAEEEGALRGPLEHITGLGTALHVLLPQSLGLDRSDFVKLQFEIASALFLESQNVSRV